MRSARRQGRRGRWMGMTLTAVVLGAALAAPAQAALPQQSGLVDLATGANVRFTTTEGNTYAGDEIASAGDVNGDGIDDALIGASGASPAGRSGAGSAFVVFGGADPPNATLSALGGRGFRINGATAGDSFGSAVAPAGDVNGDGLDDVVAGAYASDGYRGRAYVIFGKRDTATVDLAALGTGGFRIDGQATEDWLGGGVAGGRDVNGDGRDDIVVGAYRADNNSRASSGSLYVIFGRTATTTIDAASLGSAGYRIDGPLTTPNGALGLSVALTGDMNGDGRPEVLAGASSLSVAGAAFVVFGKASTTAVDLAALGSAGYRINGAAGDGFGTGTAAPGDWNGDGRADLVVAANVADNNGRTNSGSTYVLYGKADTATQSLSGFNASMGLRIDGALADKQTGRAVAAPGDVNGDGRGDLLLGTYALDPPGRANAGTAYVVYGTGASGTQDLAALPASGGYTIYGARADGYMDAVGAAGDLNADGRPDLLLGAGNASPGGEAYVLYGFGPQALAYGATSRSGKVGVPLEPLSPSLVKRTGTASFSVSPALPAGVTIDPATGTIGGTPTAGIPATPFTVTMTDLAGSASAVVTLDVAAAPATPAGTPARLTLKNLKVRCVKPRKGRLCRVQLSFTLSEKATVSVALRRTAGKRRALGTVKLKGRAGKNTFLLPATVKRRALQAGKLKLSVGAAAGSRRTTAVARTVTVRKVKRAVR